MRALIPSRRLGHRFPRPLPIPAGVMALTFVLPAGSDTHSGGPA